MNSHDDRPPQPAAFAGAIPENYDRCLGPFLFDRFASDLAERTALRTGEALLETSCGTGISTAALAALAPERSRIVATDVSEPMLDSARSLRGELACVQFRQADAAALPFEDAEFDALASQFGLMFVPDKLAALREARRVLRPGGRILLSVWDDYDSNPYVRVTQDAIASFFESDPPEFLEVPWSLSDRATVRGLFESANFSDVELETVTIRRSLPAARSVAEGFVRGNPTIDTVEERARASVEEVIEGVAHALGERFGHAPFEVQTQAVVVTARRG